MAQPNVMREPSMEEILASIRRIIENNDPAENLDLNDFSGSRQQEQEPIELTIDEDIAVTAASAAPLSAPRSAPLSGQSESPVANRTAEPQASASARPMSLADVAARVKAASERRSPAPPANDSDRFHDVSSQPARAVEPQAEPVQAFEARDQGTHDAATAEPQLVQPVEEKEFAMDDEDRHEPHFSAEADEMADAPSVDSDPAEPFAAEIGNRVAAAMPAQLLSPSVQEKVSRSFDELAEALGGSKRTLDEIAEEMLRPMLQDWLDDNLPTLVERLVREEIERVARGPRR